MSEETLGQRIRAARQERDWSQEKLAEKVGVASLSVIRWELDRSIPRGDEVQLALIEALSLRKEDFKKRKNVQPKSEGKGAQLHHQAPYVEQTSPLEDVPQEPDEYIEVVIPPMKVYRGWRAPMDGIEKKHPRVTVNGRTLPYFNTSGPSPLRIEENPETEIVYEWGYGGGGPRKLGESILADYFEETTPEGWADHADYRALQYGEDFKWEFVYHFPHDEWEITAEEIAAWLLDLKKYPRNHEEE